MVGDKSSKKLEEACRDCEHSLMEVYIRILRGIESSDASGKCLNEALYWAEGYSYKQTHDQVKMSDNNALYYAICFGNLEVLASLINSIDNGKVLDELLSKAYMLTKVNNVSVLKEIDFFIKTKLISLRFYSDKTPASLSIGEIEERIHLVIENINFLLEDKKAVVDDIFLYRAKFVTQNLYILKQHLKTTFTLLPWKEIVFCLVSFISAHTQSQELGFFYHSLLTKESILKYLKNFTNCLEDWLGTERKIPITDVRKLNSMTRSSREEIIAGILKASPSFQDLYDDFAELRDIYSLNSMKQYIDASASADCGTRVGQLTLKRTLQVMGEQLKNTVESPNLSSAVSEKLILSAPRETRKILTALRNSLSHAHVFQQMEEKTALIFYSNMQNDVKKIGNVISEMLYFKLINKIKLILNNIVKCNSMDEFYTIMDAFWDINISDYPKMNNEQTIKEQWQIEVLFEEINENVVDKTEGEKDLIHKICKIFEQSKNIFKKLFEEYSTGLKMVSAFCDLSFQEKGQSNTDGAILKGKINAAKKISKHLSPTVKSSKLEDVDDLIMLLKEFYCSVEYRIQNDVAVKIQRLIDKICHIFSYEKDSIKWIDDFREQVTAKKGKVVTENLKPNISVVSQILEKQKVKKENNNYCEYIVDTKMAEKEVEEINTENKNNPKDITKNKQPGAPFVQQITEKKQKEKNNNIFKGGKLIEKEIDQKPMLKTTDGEDKMNTDIEKNTKGVTENKEDCQIIVQPSETKLKKGKGKRKQTKEERRGELLKNTKNITSNKQTLAEIYKKIKLELSLLREILQSYSLFLEDNNSTNDNNYKFAIEMSLLDILSQFHELKLLIGNVLFLDDNAPVLTGKTLRNHLAHGNHLVDTFYPDTFLAVYINAKKLTESEITYDKTIGFSLNNNVDKLKEIYERSLCIIDKQTKMCKTIREGKFEDFKRSLIEGGDINFRSLDLRTSLHLAAEGPNLEIVKFLINDKRTDVNVKCINGQTALHISAAHGRESIVKFLAEEVGLPINGIDHNGDTPLHIAAQHGHMKTVETLLKLKADEKIKNVLSCSPLHNAARNNHISTVNVLLENGAKVDIRDGIAGFTSLHMAVEYGHVEMVKYLLDKNANVNTKNYKGGRPLHSATISDRLDVVKILVERGANINAKTLDMCKTALHGAVENGNVEMVMFLLKAGTIIDAENKDVYITPLHTAASLGLGDIVQLLINHGANVNIVQYDGMTPLMCAAKSGNANVVNILIQNGSLINITQFNGLSALHISALCGHNDIVKALIDVGIEINKKDKNLMTPLHLAIQFCREEVVKTLLEGGANVNSVGADDSTPLHISASEGSVNISEKLIQKGANVISRNSDTFTPLHVAAKKPCNKDTIEQLIRNGTDVDIKCFYGSTPLHVASLYGHFENVKTLINKNADINAKTIHKDTALHMAAEGNHKAVVVMLIDNGADVNAVNETHSSALLCAVKYDHKEIVDLLIAKGVDINDNGGAALMTAITEGHKSMVEAFLNTKDINLDVRDYSGDTLLHLAVRNGNWNIGNLLIRKGVQTDAINDQNITPLAVAVFLGNIKFVNILLEHGANINTTKPDPLLQVAVLERYPDIVEILLRQGARVIKDEDGRTPLEIAIGTGQFQIVQILFQFNTGIDVNEPGLNGHTFLHMAAISGNLDIVKYLVKRGANINAIIPNNGPKKPIHLAAQQGHIECVEFFLDVGMDIDDTEGDGFTMLHYAAIWGKAELAKILINKLANVNAFNQNALQPIHLASMRGFVDVVHILLDSGAFYNKENSSGKTPKDLTQNNDIIKIFETVEELFNAVDGNDLLAVEKLINDGATVNAKISDNFTVLHIAAKNGFFEVCDVLLKNKANPNIAGLHGIAPLHFAAEMSHFGIVQSLLTHGAMYNVMADSGVTPLEVAKETNIKDLLNLVGESFSRVENGDEKVSDKLRELDVNIVKAVMKARNSENKTLVVVGIQNSYPEIEALKQILQDTATLTLIKSRLLIMQENFVQALNLLEKVLEERREMLGEDSPGTVGIQIQIAMVLQKQSKYPQAWNLLEIVYQKQIGALGLDSKASLSTKSRIVSILQRQGKYKECLDILQEVHKKQIELLTVDHTDVLETTMHLASTLNALKKYEEALKVGSENYTKCLEILGPNKFTMNVYNNMAITLNNLGRHDEAFCIYNDVWETRKKILAPDHSDTMRARHNMAVALMGQEKYNEALEIFQEVLARQKIFLGPSHIDTLQTQRNIASVFLLKNEPMESMNLYKEGTNLRQNIWKSDHSHTSLMDKVIQELESSAKRAYFDYNSLQKNHLHLVAATAEGNAEKVKELLNDGCNVNAVTEDGRTALHEAVIKGFFEIVTLLLAAGAHQTITNAEGKSCLHDAVSSGNLQITANLLHNYKQKSKFKEFNDFINSRTFNGGVTPLHIAAEKGSLDTVRCLLKNGACYNIANDCVPLQCSSNESVTQLLELIGELFMYVRKGDRSILDQLEEMKLEDLHCVMSARDESWLTLAEAAFVYGHESLEKALKEMFP